MLKFTQILELGGSETSFTSRLECNVSVLLWDAAWYELQFHSELQRCSSNKFRAEHRLTRHLTRSIWSVGRYRSQYRSTLSHQHKNMCVPTHSPTFHYSALEHRLLLCVWFISLFFTQPNKRGAIPTCEEKVAFCDYVTGMASRAPLTNGCRPRRSFVLNKSSAVGG